MINQKDVVKTINEIIKEFENSNPKNIQLLDPFTLIERLGLKTSTQRFERFIDSCNENVKELYDFFKQKHKISMFYDDGFINLRKDMADKGLNMFSSAGILSGITLVVPSEKEIDKRIERLFLERREVRKNKVKELEKFKDDRGF